MLSIFFLFYFGICRAQQAPYPPDVAGTLAAATKNQGELEKVLANYAAPEDSLRYKAACFLIANMEGHCYVTYALEDTNGNELGWSIFDYQNYDSLENAWGRLESLTGPLDFKKKEMINDLDTITAAFLIDNIDYAFKAWRERPWATGLSFTDFCEYVLPYRGSNEPLELWRKTFLDRFADLQTKMTNPTDPIEAAKLINEDVKSWFGFDPRYYYHPIDQGLSEMLVNKKGRCEDMTNLAIYAMRANGLAVTSDYTPFWANTGNNHAWNAIVAGDGRVFPFMGAEANPGDYHLANKLAKAYRKTYAKQPNNLIFQKRKQEKVPGWLAGRNYCDITRDYTKVSDAAVVFKTPIPDSVDIAYLCVFNSGEWQAIHWGKIINSSATFAEMGTDIAYLPALYLNEEIAPFGEPFILGPDSIKQELKPDTIRCISIELVSTTARKQELSTDGIAKTFLTPGQTYELFYWSDGWKSLGKASATEKPLVFNAVPSGCLYWLVADSSDKEERIFTINDSKQVWW